MEIEDEGQYNSAIERLRDLTRLRQPLFADNRAELEAICAAITRYQGAGPPMQRSRETLPARTVVPSPAPEKAAQANIRLSFAGDAAIGFIDREARSEGGWLLTGWLLSKRPIWSLNLILNDGSSIVCAYGKPRPDIEKAFGKHYPNTLNSGWSAIVPKGNLPINFFGDPENVGRLRVTFLDQTQADSSRFAVRTENKAEFFKTNKPIIDEIGHGEWKEYLVEHFDKPGVRILEVGSRAVVGGVTKKLFQHAEHVGFDIMEGENVDIVGDAHRLTRYFAPGDKYDLVFSAAVFEHLAMPWVVSTEIVKMMKVGGHVFTETHYCYSSHQLPWHFFQFSDTALRILFNPKMGIECVKAGVSNPMVAYFGPLARPGLIGTRVHNMYCHSEMLGKKVNDAVDHFSWADTDITDVVGQTMYPKPASA